MAEPVPRFVGFAQAMLMREQCRSEQLTNGDWPERFRCGTGM